MATTDVRRKFIKALETIELPEHEWVNILFFVKMLSNSRKGNIRPPTPEQWNNLPLWLKWKIYLIALFYANAAELQKAVCGFFNPKIT